MSISVTVPRPARPVGYALIGDEFGVVPSWIGYVDGQVVVEFEETPESLALDLAAIKTWLETPEFPVDTGFVLYPQPTPPWPDGSEQPASVIGHEWRDTSRGNLSLLWDGNMWVAQPLGREGTADDVIAGKVIPVNATSVLGWGVPDPAEAPVRPSGLYAWPWRSIPPAPAASKAYTAAGTENVAAGTTRGSDGKWYAGFYDPSTNTYEVHAWADGDTTRTLVNTGLPLTGVSDGIAVIGDALFVRDGLFLRRYTLDRTGGPIGTGTQVGASDATRATVGIDEDGAALLVVSVAGGAATSGFTVQRVDTAGNVTATLFTVAAGAFSGYLGSQSVLAGQFDLGASRVLLIDRNDVVRSFGRTGTRYPAEDFTAAPRSWERTMGWDGTRFVFQAVAGTTDEGKELAARGTTTLTLASRVKTAQPLTEGYVWGDTDPAGTGLHESALSPTVARTISPRQWCVMQTSEPPTGDYVDQPDTVQPYVSVGGGPFYAQAVHSSITATDGLTRRTFLDDVMFTTTGTMPGDIPPFPDEGDSGSIVSEVGGAYFLGDGRMWSPWMVERIFRLADARYQPKSK